MEKARRERAEREKARASRGQAVSIQRQAKTFWGMLFMFVVTIDVTNVG